MCDTKVESEEYLKDSPMFYVPEVVFRRRAGDMTQLTTGWFFYIGAGSGDFDTYNGIKLFPRNVNINS